MKNLTGRKLNVVGDELNIKGGGIYCFLPFLRIDKNKKAVFKIGLAKNFQKRIDTYHTYFPNGMYMVAFLEDPPIPKLTRSNQTKIYIEETNTYKYPDAKLSQFLKIEKFILKYLDTNGGKRIHSTSRVRNQNEQRQGETEWIYTNDQTIHEAFTEAQKKFGGKTHLYYLEGFDPDTNKIIDSINSKAKEKEDTRPNYTGKIIYFV